MRRRRHLVLRVSGLWKQAVQAAGFKGRTVMDCAATRWRYQQRNVEDMKNWVFMPEISDFRLNKGILMVKHLIVLSWTCTTVTVV